MAEGGVPQIVAEGYGLRQILVEAQRAGEGAGYARDLIERAMADFEYVGEEQSLPVIEYQEDARLLEQGLIKKI